MENKHRHANVKNLFIIALNLIYYRKYTIMIKFLKRNILFFAFY